MQRQPTGFTLLEVTVVFILGLFTLVFIFPMFERRGCRLSRTLQNNTHLAGIHKGMVLFAMGNRGWYPGFDGNGEIEASAIPPGPGVYGTDSVNGAEPRYRFAVMMRGNYFSPEYILSPGETNLVKQNPQSGQSISANHFSFAMLRIDRPALGNRRQEWQQTQNPRAIVLSDRNLSANAGAHAQSVFATPECSWRGSIAFNDGHVELSMSNVRSTAYHSTPPPTWPTGGTGPAAQVAADDLFADDKDHTGRYGNDAAMVYHDARSFVNQK